MSKSTGWADNIAFAMAPLGIHCNGRGDSCWRAPMAQGNNRVRGTPLRCLYHPQVVMCVSETDAHNGVGERGKTKPWQRAS